MTEMSLCLFLDRLTFILQQWSKLCALGVLILLAYVFHGLRKTLEKSERLFLLSFFHAEVLEEEPRE